jgi:hypothetical protein
VCVAASRQPLSTPGAPRWPGISQQDKNNTVLAQFSHMQMRNPTEGPKRHSTPQQGKPMCILDRGAQFHSVCAAQRARCWLEIKSCCSLTACCVPKPELHSNYSSSCKSACRAPGTQHDKWIHHKVSFWLATSLRLHEARNTQTLSRAAMKNTGFSLGAMAGEAHLLHPGPPELD